MSASSFLSIVERAGKSGDGDQYGGAKGSDGSGLPSGSPGNFMFATGVECSYPTIGHGSVRRDLLEECGHYKHYKKDLALVREMGLHVLRYGLPIHKVFRGPSRYDWSFADEAMNEIRRLKITPILDLLHFGLPDWLGNFQNPEMPLHFANYAEAVAKRYSWVRFYTPVNEIYVTAKLSAKDGLWNEQLKSDRGFVTALKHCVAASILATQRIAKHRPDCVIVQSESAEYVHSATSTPNAEIELQNKLRFSSLDLLYAHPPDADVYVYLTSHGMTKNEYAWFMRGEPPGYQVMGNDYYGRNEKIVLPDGTEFEAEDVMGWYQMTRRYYERYRKPTMHTETNHFDPEIAPKWLWKQWINILEMRRVGVPVLGFTWYSLIDQIDWDSALAKKDGHVNACGLYDLDRKERPVAKAYRELLKEFGRITIVPKGELFQITDRASVLKVEV